MAKQSFDFNIFMMVHIFFVSYLFWTHEVESILFKAFAIQCCLWIMLMRIILMGN